MNSGMPPRVGEWACGSDGASAVRRCPAAPARPAARPLLMVSAYGVVRVTQRDKPGPRAARARPRPRGAPPWAGPGIPRSRRWGQAGLSSRAVNLADLARELGNRAAVQHAVAVGTVLA